MWLSKQMMIKRQAQDAAAVGTVSIGGTNAAVVTDAERRQAVVIAPGGYFWQPKTSERVMVLHANEDFIPGVPVGGEALAPGEVKIYSDGAQITLQNDGSILISGNVEITGSLRVNGREVVLK